MAKLSISGQITEVDWSIEQLRRWYDHRINTRLIKQSEAELHMEQMRAVLETLNWFADNEAFIRFCFKHRARIVDEIKEISDEQGAAGVDRGDAGSDGADEGEAETV